jgi:hypothetical protein
LIVDENPDKIGNLINFHKHKLVYNILSDNLKAVSVSPDIQAVDEVGRFLDNLPSLSEKELYEYSLLREPRNAARADIR